MTLTVAGILFALAIPSMARFLNSNQLTSATNSLLADLQLARSEAIKRGTQAVLCKSADSSTCSTSAGVSWASGWLVYADLNNDSAWSTANDALLGVQEALPGDLTIDTAPGDSVVYTRQGLLASAAGQYEICSTPLGEGQIIDLSATGRPNLLEGATC